MNAVYVKLKELTCWCGTPYAAPETMANSAINDGHTIYCPHGHTNVWKETEADRIRKDLERERRRVANLEDNLRCETLSHRATKGKVTKLRKRIENGVCPECHRHFPNLEAHMSTQHMPVGDE